MASGPSKSSLMASIQPPVACEVPSGAQPSLPCLPLERLSRFFLCRSLPGNAWQALVLTDLVDDLQHALAEGGILHLELLEQTAVIHQIVAGPFFPPGMMLESNARVGEKLPYHVGQLPQADRRATRV